MNGSALAPGLLFASLGLFLSFGASRRVMMFSLAAMLAAALVAGVTPVGPQNLPEVLIGCWISLFAAVVCAYLPAPVGYRIAVPLCVNGGLWAGLALAASGDRLALVPAVLWAGLCVPGAWLVRGGRGIVVKVAGSWLAAAAILSLGLNMTPTLGYEPDHRE